MAPCRQVLMWSVPSIAVLLGIFWFRRKREFAKSDPGGREKIKSLQEELAEVLNAEFEAIRVSPLGKTDPFIIKSAPIDIIPNGTGSQHSSPLELTDEEVDLEIEKIIRKNTLEKERKMSGFVNHKMVINTNITEIPFVAKETSNMFGSLKTEMSCNKSETDVGSISSTDNTNVTSDEKTEAMQLDSTKCDSSPSETITNDEITVADTEEVNNDNLVEVSSNNDESCNTNNNSFSTMQPRHISERDSANHSPVDPMLASPSMCHFSDNHSEVRKKNLPLYLLLFYTFYN